MGGEAKIFLNTGIRFKKQKDLLGVHEIDYVNTPTYKLYRPIARKLW